MEKGPLLKQCVQLHCIDALGLHMNKVLTRMTAVCCESQATLHGINPARPSSKDYCRVAPHRVNPRQAILSVAQPGLHFIWLPSSDTALLSFWLEFQALPCRAIFVCRVSLSSFIYCQQVLFNCVMLIPLRRDSLVVTQSVTVLGVVIAQLCNAGTLVEGQSCHDTVCCCVRGGIVQLCNVGTLVEGQSCDDIVCCCVRPQGQVLFNCVMLVPLWRDSLMVTQSVAVLGVGIVQLCNVGTLVEGQSCDDIVCCCDCVRGRYCSAV